MFCSQYVTRFGYGTVYASDSGVVNLEIPDMRCTGHVEVRGSLPFEPSHITDRAALLLQQYFSGLYTDFTTTPVDLAGLTAFQRAVLINTRLIAYGEIWSYRQLSERSGYSSAARAVGGALAINPIPIIIPCHRVTSSKGHLTGFSAPGGVDTKKALLSLEGISTAGMYVVNNQAVMHRM